MKDIRILNERIKGEELSAVQFVQDYLQLHFQNKGFTFYIWPSIQIKEKNFDFGDRDYRNKLCEIIGEKVNKVLIENNILIIDLLCSKIKCNLDSNNIDIISDICIFQDGTDWWIW